MEEKRKYLTYDRFIIPVKLHYYGYTDDVDVRKQRGYKTTALQQYIDEYGWDNISTTIVTEGLTKKEAKHLEDQLIIDGWKRGDCINEHRSGGIKDNPAEYYRQYMKQYRQTHKEKVKQYINQYRDKHKEDLKQYNKQYRDKHKEERKQYNKKYNKQWLSTPAGKIYNRVKSYNHDHPDRMIITPMEARDMYELTGYIPNFIKNDDLI